ncbi:MAG: hypothetical protein OEW45_15990, partial [Deltaproteobacteria bacterium]|nr:hypothetical protein [Deltaproteobacteria bacterium]
MRECGCANLNEFPSWISDRIKVSAWCGFWPFSFPGHCGEDLARKSILEANKSLERRKNIMQKLTAKWPIFVAV